jgi:L-cystine transport system permease protein
MGSLNYTQIWDSFVFALHFLPNTLLLLVVPFFLCLVLGLLVAIARVWQVPVLAQVLQVVLTLLKGIPVYLLLIVSNLLYTLYFDKMAAALGWSIRTDDINILYFAIAIITIAFLPGMSELLRGGLMSVPAGQYEAGYASGLSKWQTMRRIILPQMVPEVLPGMTNLLIALLKAGALSYALGVTDIMNAAVRAASNAYNLLEGYIAAALIYWGLSILIEQGMGLLVRRVGKYQKQLTT